MQLQKFLVFFSHSRLVFGMKLSFRNLIPFFCCSAAVYLYTCLISMLLLCQLHITTIIIVPANFVFILFLSQVLSCALELLVPLDFMVTLVRGDK